MRSLMFFFLSFLMNDDEIFRKKGHYHRLYFSVSDETFLYKYKNLMSRLLVIMKNYKDKNDLITLISWR